MGFFDRCRMRRAADRARCYDYIISIRSGLPPAVLRDNFGRGGHPDGLRRLLLNCRQPYVPEAWAAAAEAESWARKARRLFRRWDRSDARRLADFLSCYAAALRMETGTRTDVMDLAGKLADCLEKLGPDFFERMLRFNDLNK